MVCILQDQIVQGKCSGSSDLEDSLAGFAEGDLAVFRHGHGVAAVQRHSAVIGFDAVCIHILQGTVDGQGAGYPCGDIERGSDLDRGSFRAPVHIFGEGDGAAAETDSEGDRFPQGVFAVIGINRICGGGHDQAGGVVSAHGVEPCPATVGAGDIPSGFRIGQERICLNGDPFRAVVILEVVGPVHLELDPAGESFIKDGQQSAGNGEFFLTEDLFQGGPGFCTFRHEDGIGICRGGGGRVNAGVEIDRSGTCPFQNGVIHVCTAADRVDHIRAVVRDRGTDDDHRAVSVDIDGICRRVAEDFRIGDKGGSAPGTEHIRSIFSIGPAGDQQIALIEQNAVLGGMSGEDPAIDRKRAVVVDGAAVELCRIAVKHSVGDRGGSGGMDRAAGAGKVVAAINAVPVKGSAIDGETAGAVNGAAVHRLAVADIHIGQRERAGVIDGAAVALARVSAGERHIADGHAAARRDGEDLDRIAAGNGQGALIDPVTIYKRAVDRDVCRHVQCAQRRIQRQRCAGAERPGPQPVGGVGEGDRLIAAFLIGVFDRFPEAGLAVGDIHHIIQCGDGQRINGERSRRAHGSEGGVHRRAVCIRPKDLKGTVQTVLVLGDFNIAGSRRCGRCYACVFAEVTVFHHDPGVVCGVPDIKGRIRCLVEFTAAGLMINRRSFPGKGKSFHGEGTDRASIRIEADPAAENSCDQVVNGVFRIQRQDIIRTVNVTILCIVESHIARLNDDGGIICIDQWVPDSGLSVHPDMGNRTDNGVGGCGEFIGRDLIICPECVVFRMLVCTCLVAEDDAVPDHNVEGRSSI